MKDTPTATRGRESRGSKAATAARTATGIEAVKTECQEFELSLAEALDRSRLPESARKHLAVCAACESMMSDFNEIAQQVRDLTQDGPTTDLWPDIRAQLMREGIIHNGDRAPASAANPAMPKLVHSVPNVRR